MAVASLGLLALAALPLSCRKSPAVADDPQLAARGTVEVTARLVEIPDGAIIKRDHYDYATVLKYEVVKVHRGEVKGSVIFVAHYDPWKPRSDAADRRAKNIGGDLRQFQAGDLHRMALSAPVDDYYMGGIINKYFGGTTDPVYWAEWTDAAGE